MLNNNEKLDLQTLIMQLEQFDYSEVLDAITPIIVYYVSRKTINTYYLHRDYKPKSISKVILPPELTKKYSEVDFNKIAAQKYGEYIVSFANVMIKNFPTEDLTNFYNNINEVKAKPKRFGLLNLIFHLDLAGFYNTKKNIIFVEKGLEDHPIQHELFHMASSPYKNGIKYSGFQVSSIGEGINEGYTELLTQRYFPNEDNDEDNDIQPYDYHVSVAKKLEQIIEREKMQSLYLNANLKGLIDELKQYISEDEIMKFISNTDFLVKYMDDKRLQLFEKKMISNCLENVNRFLIICYAKKMQQQFKDGKFSSISEMLQNLAEYISTLNSHMEIGKYDYEVMSIEDIQEILRDCFENPNITVSIKLEEQESPKR